jgi:hypothetical protein
LRWWLGLQHKGWLWLRLAVGLWGLGLWLGLRLRLSLGLARRKNGDRIVHALRPRSQLCKRGRRRRADPHLPTGVRYRKRLTARHAQRFPGEILRRAQDGAVKHGYLCRSVGGDLERKLRSPHQPRHSGSRPKTVALGEDLAEQDVQGSDAHTRRRIALPVADQVPHTQMTSRPISISSPCWDLRNGWAHAVHRETTPPH